MSLNDGQHAEFNNELEDEYGFDAHDPPGTEIGEGLEEVEPDDQEPLRLEHDYGSGSYAEDGRLEVAEDKTMMNGEAQVGSAAMFGPTEIGENPLEHQYEIGSTESADRGGSEIGFSDIDGFDEDISDSYVSEALGSTEAADRGGFEIGSTESADRGGFEIGNGYIARDGASEIGHGHFPLDGGSEIGAHANVMAPFEGFMLEDTRMGYDDKFTNEFGIDAVGGDFEDGYGDGFYKRGSKGGSSDYSRGFDEGSKDIASASIGAGHYPVDGASEIGAAEAVAKVIEKARDSRQPAPPMKAVDVDAPFSDHSDWGLTDLMIGASVATGDPEMFPLFSQMLLRAGATMTPRIVRVDTEASYNQFKVEQSPELADLKRRFEAHVSDPNAHGLSSDIEEETDDFTENLAHIGAEVEAVEAEKRVEMWMPTRFDGVVTAWREGGFVCASLVFPGRDGEMRICTSIEPIRKCVEEMSRHAAEANVPASAVVGCLTEMGCVLGAGTVMKEVTAAASSILARHEADLSAPFMVRIEPKTSPYIAALMMLAASAKNGVPQAQGEWKKLGELSPGPIKQAMLEAVHLAKAAGA